MKYVILEKARTLGAKDVKKRKRRQSQVWDELVRAKYELKNSTSDLHPKFNRLSKKVEQLKKEYYQLGGRKKYI
jgi:uncharacterized membrane-anchored protein YhcB (DUF1043 family)